MTRASTTSIVPRLASAPCRPENSAPVVSPSILTEAPAADPSAGTLPVRRPADGRRPHRRKRLWPVLATLALSITLIVLHPLGMARVVGAAMSPTLRDGTVAAVRARWAWEGGIHRGDVVVFGDPGGWGRLAAAADGGRAPSSFVRRVVAVAGQTVQCCDVYGRLVVDGHALTGRYGDDGAGGPYRITVPPDHLWVVADNPADPLGSGAMRTTPGHGLVPVGAVTGVVLPRP